jgi:TolA-binding protein
MRIFFLSLIFFLFTGAGLNAQSSRILKDKADSVLKKKSDCLKKQKKYAFFYIQIYNGSDVNKAKSVLKDFIEKYPNSKAFVTWENPEYKVWTGEYYTRFEVERAMQILRDEYPDALIVYPKKH